MAKEEPTVLLDRIDIDTHGLLNRVELGPFSQAMNLVRCQLALAKPLWSGLSVIHWFDANIPWA